MLKKTLFLIFILPLVIISMVMNSAQVWRYAPDGGQREEWNNDSLYFHYVTTGIDSITSKKFSMPEGYNGKLSLYMDYIGSGTVNFRLLFNTGAGYIKSDYITFEAHNATDGSLSNTIYSYSTDGQSSGVEGDVVYAYKVQMITDGAVDLKIRMSWLAY
jgi:hypothetical protein